MREYDVIVENIRNQQCVTVEDIRALCELGVPAVNICVKAVLADNFLKELDKFVNVRKNYYFLLCVAVVLARLSSLL